MYLKYGTQLPYIKYGTHQTGTAPPAPPSSGSSTTMYYGSTEIASAHILVSGTLTQVTLSYTS